MESHYTLQRSLSTRTKDVVIPQAYQGHNSLSGIMFLKNMELIVSKSSGGSKVSLERTFLGPAYVHDSMWESKILT